MTGTPSSLPRGDIGRHGHVIPIGGQPPNQYVNNRKVNVTPE